MKSDITYLEFNDWSEDHDYPSTPFVREIITPYVNADKSEYNIKLIDDTDWLIENQLCVRWFIVDQSITFYITALTKWVKDYIPEIFTQYPNFVRYPDKHGKVYGTFSDTITFLPFHKNNFGSHETMWL